ncbi:MULTISPECIES: GNAT family N-acetyltransferase [Bacillota]|uniref:GNAT family N-acetyltransferase n=2 Tax=Amedibacillus TaxID=2749846 RepID=A0A7G9GJG4_9FIRM|nr:MULTISPECIES: GNAT family N-acetyltransferase [Bacillota]MCH4285382.1 GNAT family N-acetyltransferase [Amedibacillus hominis]QNM10946.1 GNAT family N-acetyltransferase [[Eubacterium] hominis]RGC52952.1 GNAT family N-acetyltransferase [Absiella sp. AM29-15]RGB58438.1 GNAT family N-acetyltransferase [Absiella sp. AM22-9]RGB63326.1 GNAT family N-acetyltransferase [Absiella sp. AM10-20]
MQYTKTVFLKNNKECLLRNAVGTDAEEIHKIFNLTHAQTDFLCTYPDENLFDTEEERYFLLEKERSANEIEICAVVGGHIVGTAGIEAVGKKDKVKHRAEFGISIEKGFWGIGIGYALTVACVECAKAAGYMQLELNVVSENRRAISLYEGIGFREYGRNPKGFRSRKTGWQEIVLMRMELA